MVYKLLFSNFPDFYKQLPVNVVEDIILQIKNVLDHEIAIDQLKDAIVLAKDFKSAAKLRTIEVIIVKSIRKHVLDTYGIILTIKNYLENKDLYQDAPVLPLNEINERFSNIDAQNFETILLA